MRISLLWLTLALLLLVPASAQQKKEVSVPLPAYPDNPAGLRRLIEDILKTSKSGDSRTVDAYLKSLLIPDPDGWFRQIFGDARGARFAAEYQQDRGRLLSQLSERFASALQENMTEIDARRFDKACDPEADEYEYPLLLARQRPELLYEVRFFRRPYVRVLWAFAYIDGAFRYAGDLRISPLFPRPRVPGTASGAPPGSSTNTEPKRIQVGGAVQHARLIHSVPPEYPDRAKQALLQGTVRLAAIIGRDGNIENLQVIEGPCWLAESALKAVKQWRYSPVLLQGEPVEVQTTIDVVYKLSRRL